MQALDLVLAVLHLGAIVVTRLLWTIIDLRPGSKLRQHLRAVWAVHFASLNLVPMFWNWPMPSTASGCRPGAGDRRFYEVLSWKRCRTPAGRNRVSVGRSSQPPHWP